MVFDTPVAGSLIQNNRQFESNSDLIGSIVAKMRSKTARQALSTHVAVDLNRSSVTTSAYHEPNSLLSEPETSGVRKSR